MILNNFCIYNNKVFLALDTYLVAYSYRNHVKSDNQNFQECLRIKIPTKCCNVKDIKLSNVDNYVTGLKSLLILVFDCDGLSNAFIYCNSFRKKILQIALPDWPVAIKNYSVNLFVSDGPAFLVHSEFAFHFYSVPYSINSSFELSLLNPKSTELKILQFQCCKPLFNDNFQGFLSILVICCNYSSHQTMKFIGFISEQENCGIKGEPLNTHFFFPQCYESVLKSVQVTKAIPHFKENSLSVERIESVSLICTRDDCLVFANAVLMFCCRLTIPVLDIIPMKSEFSSSCMEDSNLVLVFENRTVFFIAITESINCKVVKHWLDTEVTIIGDILRKGSKQILLMKEMKVDSWQNNCILYDMSSFMPIDLSCYNMMPNSCLKTTITELEKKVQVGVATMIEIEHDISQKSAATIDALIKLKESRVNSELLKHSNIFQESLVDLILSKDENKAECVPVEYESHVTLLDKEQRFVDRKWIISLRFINNGERSICNPSVKVLMKGNHIACIQKVFIHSSDLSLASTEDCRQINPKVKFTIVLCFEYAILHGDEEIFMILTWYCGSEDEFDNDIFITEERKFLPQDQMCLQTKISLTDYLNYEIRKDMSSLSDLLFARASQQRINLSLSSLHSDISQFENMLLKNILDVKCLVFTNENSLMFKTNLLVKNASQNEVEIEAFIRNEKEMCLLINYLYQHLPEDVTISPCLKFKAEFSQLKKCVLVCMENEINLLISAFNIHNISEEVRKNYPKLVSSHNAGIISIPKATYQRIRTVLVKKECATDILLHSNV